ncbi:methyltransferase domain-containing protein [Winogradskyella poriferorum]|uniref:methyltransferase domain-containing protein n=1 Tax=Winogradskyella poriferorum TaxID=307627 RepID=UPI003D648C06
MSAIKRPWPTKDAMAQIYKRHLWGVSKFDFYSGEGSHDPQIVKPYIEAILSFFNFHDNNLIVCDLGCGDFNVGNQLFQNTKGYIAIDIVESLINRNKNLYKAENLEFHCLDIAKDNLPKADCIILRQVLQHLSNNEIKQIVRKLSNYKYLILTEHIPNGDFDSNKDIISGQGIRLKHNSGVDLLKAPFNLSVQKASVLNEFRLTEKKGKIVTYLYELN